MLKKYAGSINTIICQNLCGFLWSAAIIMLPVSSLPLLTRLSRASSVGPASAVLLMLLAFTWLGGFLLHKRKFIAFDLMVSRLPPTISRLLLFLWIVLLSWTLSILFLEAPPFRGETPLSLAPSAFLTLALGSGVFFTSMAWLTAHPEYLRRTLRLIHYSGIAVILWSIVQAFFVFLNKSQYPELIYWIQSLISASPAGLYVGRVTGLAFEPSWLGHQLNIVYLPVWLAYTLTGSSIFRRFGPISLENILLVFGVGILLVSFSRIGWISFTLVILVIFMSGAIKIASYLRKSWLSNQGGFAQQLASILLTPVLMAGMLVVLGLAGGVAFKIGTLVEPRLALILENNPFQASSLYDFANRMFFGERMVYWATGLGVFERYPLFGVGLGNVGLYFPQNLPGFGYWLPEVINSLYRLTLTMNTKSLWIRLLAETGLVGFTAFIYWLAAISRAGFTAWQSMDIDMKVIGISGLCMLVALFAEGFSIDSFALPYIWFMAAMVSASAIHVSQLRSDPFGEVQ